MREYSVGDTVIVKRKFKDTDDCGVTCSMIDSQGKIAVIREVFDNMHRKFNRYIIDINPGVLYSTEMLIPFDVYLDTGVNNDSEL